MNRERNYADHYYHGDISGAFWYNIQNTNDADHFGYIGLQTQYKFNCCFNIVSDFKAYCKHCFTSYDDHLEYTIEKRQTSLTCLSTNLVYNFTAEHIPLVKIELDFLEHQYNQFIIDYNIIDKLNTSPPKGDTDTKNDTDRDYYDNDIDDPFENQFNTIMYDIDYDTTVDKNTKKYIARLCLGRQILYCLETYGKCNFYAET
jgi:hypothetical protein